MSTPDSLPEIQHLLIRLFEQDIDDQQRTRLLEWSRTAPDACQVYCDFIRDYAIIHTLVTGQVQLECGSSNDTRFDQALWSALGEYEKSAPEIETVKERPRIELVSKVIYPPRSKPRISTFSLAWLSATAAIVLLMFGFLRLMPQKTMVAEVVESMNAEWAGGSSVLKQGDFLCNTDDQFFLKSGIVKIRFEYGATAIFEGPSVFSCKSANLLSLQSGRVFAVVPVEASGFTVETPMSRIVDIGTEFGVQVDMDGTSAVHMLKGQAALVPGVKGKTGDSQLLTRGQARQVDPSGDVRDIPVRHDVFVRGFSSANKTIWRGGAVLSIVRLPASGTDAATGIHPDKTYTHLLDFGGGNPATINGVAFTQVDHPEIRQDRFEDPKNRFQLQKSGGMGLFQTYQENKAGAALFSDGGIRDLLADYTYHGANKGGDSYTLTLTGLQPGTHYSLRIYYCPHLSEGAARDVHLTFSAGGRDTEIMVDEAAKGAHFISYDYVADGTEVSVRFEAKSNKDWQLYGITNEIVTEE
jgi:hypothetical protein